jgi:hypothetical protein
MVECGLTHRSAVVRARVRRHPIVMRCCATRRCARCERRVDAAHCAVMIVATPDVLVASVVFSTITCCGDSSVGGSPFFSCGS